MPRKLGFADALCYVHTEGNVATQSLTFVAARHQLSNDVSFIFGAGYTNAIVTLQILVWVGLLFFRKSVRWLFGIL